MLNKFRPELALIDVSMPGYSGYEVCELIRHDPEFASIPVILLSGALDNFDEDEAARVKANDHLKKPFDPSEMIAMVEKLLRENERRKDPVFSGNVSKEADTETGITGEIIPSPVKSASGTPGEPRDFFQITPRTWESYLGTDRILEIIDNNTSAGKTAAYWRIPEEWIDRVAEKAVKKMIPDIETFITQTLSASV
jgi:hypothetical protein